MRHIQAQQCSTPATTAFAVPVGGIAERGGWTVGRDLPERGLDADIRLNADVTAAISAFHRNGKMGDEGEAQVSINERDETG